MADGAAATANHTKKDSLVFLTRERYDVQPFNVLPILGYLIK